jgi:hypothetical protein
MTVALRVFGALLFLAAFFVSRREARLSWNESSAWQQLVTLQFDAAADDAAPDSAWLPSAAGAAPDARRREATVAYWLGRYDDLVERSGGAADPDVLFVSANAAFRAARRGRPLGPDAARQLDPVLQAYGRVLQSVPRHADAAYNFEYVVRLQDQLRVMRGSPPAENRNAAGEGGPVEIREFPQGPTVHGLPGGPPPEIRAEDFEILRPRDVGERAAEPGQAPGSTLRRKG